MNRKPTELSFAHLFEDLGDAHAEWIETGKGRSKVSRLARRLQQELGTLLRRIDPSDWS